MTDEYMTLQEALATGLPFKHKDCHEWSSSALMPYNLGHESVYEKVWQVQRPKPRIRLWKNGMEPVHFYFAYGPTDSDDDNDVTKALKEILNDYEE